MSPDDDGSSLRLTWRTVAAYAGAWTLALTGIWGANHTSGAGHAALTVITGLVVLYLLYLAVAWLCLVGIAAWLDRLGAHVRSGHRDRRVPMAWWIVVAWCGLGVVGAILVAWVGMGVRGEEARWLIGSYLVGGLVVAVVFGRAGWVERHVAARVSPELGRHRRE